VSVSVTSAVMTPGMAVISFCGNDSSYSNGLMLTDVTVVVVVTVMSTVVWQIATQHGNSKRKPVV